MEKYSLKILMGFVAFFLLNYQAFSQSPATTGDPYIHGDNQNINNTVLCGEETGAPQPPEKIFPWGCIGSSFTFSLFNKNFTPGNTYTWVVERGDVQPTSGGVTPTIYAPISTTVITTSSNFSVTTSGFLQGTYRVTMTENTLAPLEAFFLVYDGGNFTRTLAVAPLTPFLDCNSVCLTVGGVRPVPYCGTAHSGGQQTVMVNFGDGNNAKIYTNGGATLGGYDFINTNCHTYSSAGYYNVTVTEDNPCNSPNPVTWSKPIYVGSPSVKITSAFQAGSNCTSNPKNIILTASSLSSGLVTAIGTPTNNNATYQWSTGATGSTITINGNTNQSYTVTATDINGCKATAIYTVGATTCSPITLNLGACGISGDASLTANPSGGATPYSYVWSNGGTTKTVSNLAGNNSYSVTVKDANGCVVCTQSSCVPPEQPLVATATIIKQPCPGTSTGQVNVIALGGVTVDACPIGTPVNRSFVWSDGVTTSTGSRTTLAAGTYSVTVNENCNLYTAGGSCNALVTFTLSPVTADAGPVQTKCINFNTLPTPVIPLGGNGTGSNGNLPYTYLWSSGATASNPTVNPTVTTTYIVTVTDAQNCKATASSTVNVISNCCTGSGTANTSCNPSASIQNTSISVLQTAFPCMFSGTTTLTWLPVSGISTFALNGTITIDRNLNINSFTLLFGPNARLVVKPGVTLTITAGLYYSCSDMWDGIVLEDNTAKLVISNSSLFHAIGAIQSRKGGVFQITNTSFYDNFIGLDVGAYSGSHTANGSFIKQSTFQSLGVNLKAPFANFLRPEFGIRITNNANVTIGDPANTPATANNFTGITCGIANYPNNTLYNNTTILKNNIFNNILWNSVSGSGGAQHPGVGVYSKPTNTNPIFTSNIEVYGYGLNNSTVNFNNCNRGFIADGAQIFKVQDNRLSNIYIGIEGRFNSQPGGSMTVNYNRIEGNTPFGIVANGINGGYKQILQNIITLPSCTTNAYSGSGSSVAYSQNYYGIREVSCNPIGGWVGGNTITGGRFALLIQSSGSSLVTANDFTVNNQYNSTTTGRTFGIYADNSNNINVSGNNIHGTLAFNAADPVANEMEQTRGVTLMSTTNSRINCNTLTDMLGYGLEFWNSNTGYVTANLFSPGSSVNDKRLKFNIALQNFSTNVSLAGNCGLQTSPTTVTTGNLWNNGYGTYYGNTAYNSAYKILTNGTGSGNASRFLYHDLSAVQAWDNPGNTLTNNGGVVVQKVSQSLLPWQCSNGIPALKMAPAAITSMAIGANSAIVAGKQGNPAWDILSDWFGRRKNFRDICLDSVNCLKDSTLRAFYKAQKNTEVDMCEQLSLGIQSLGDSALFKNSTKWQTKLDQLIKLNSQLPTTVAYVKAERDLNAVRLNMLKDKRNILTTSEQSLVKQYAGMCPYEGGFAVYTARDLYALIDPSVVFLTMDVCNPAATATATVAKTDDTATTRKSSWKPDAIDGMNGAFVNDFQFSPNPSNSGVFTLTYRLNPEHCAGVSIFSPSGGRVHQQKICGTENKATINLSEQPSGVYIVQIVGEGMYLKKDRLVITH